MKKPDTRKIKSFAHQTGRGFTLVEVLVVIAIISILMTAGAIGLGNLTAGKGTSSAIATCESLFEEARTIAVSKRCRARVLIDAGDKTKDSYLRRIVIAHEKIDANGNVIPDNWVLASRGYTMPAGTYYSREFSKLDPSGKIEETTLSGADISSSYRGNYAYYEFNGEGIFEKPGASFVIGSGARPPKGEPRTTSSAGRDFAGFVIWRNGRTSTFRSPEQMEIPKNATTF